MSRESRVDQETRAVLEERGRAAARELINLPDLNPYLVQIHDPQEEQRLETGQDRYENLIFIANALAVIKPDHNRFTKERWVPQALKLGRQIDVDLVPHIDVDSLLSARAFDYMAARMQPQKYASVTWALPQHAHDVAHGHVELGAPVLDLVRS